MSSYQHLALFVDYQDHYLQWLPKPTALAFKQNARALADRFREKESQIVWVMTQCSNGSLYHLPPHFVAAEDRCPASAQESTTFKRLCFDPSLIRDDEAYLIKYGNNALTSQNNAMLSHFQNNDALIKTTICGINTTKCIASTTEGALMTPIVHRCTVLIDQVADMGFERAGRNPPAWHQHKLLTLLTGDKRKLSLLTAQDYLAKMGRLHP